jgi:hypothetical protein
VWIQATLTLTVGASLFLFIGMSMFGTGRLKNQRITTGYEQIQVGSSQHDVQRLLGNPDVMGPCGRFFYEHPEPGCHEEYVYLQSHAPAVPMCWRISFDIDGRVMSKDSRLSVRTRPHDSGGGASVVR